MTRLTARQRFGERASRLLRDVRRKFINRFDLALELEAVVLDAPSQNQRRPAAVGIVDELPLRNRRVLPKQFVRNLSAFNRCARISELVREVTQLAGDRAPTSADARLRDA